MRILIGMCILFLAGCAETTTSSTPNLSSWQGRNIQAVEQSLGHANLVAPEGNGNTVYTYEVQASGKSMPQPMTSNTTVLVTPKGTAIGVPPEPARTSNASLLTCAYVFEADSRGKILRASTGGGGCGS